MFSPHKHCSSFIDEYHTVIISTAFRLRNNKALCLFVYGHYANITFQWVELFVDHSTFDHGSVNIKKSSKILETQPHTVFYNKPYFAQPSSEKLINRPTILTPVCSEPAYFCKVWTGIKGNYVCLLLCIFTAREPFLKTDIFVQTVSKESIKMMKLWASFRDHSPSSCPKLRNSY